MTDDIKGSWQYIKGKTCFEDGREKDIKSHNSLLTGHF